MVDTTARSVRAEGRRAAPADSGFPLRDVLLLSLVAAAIAVSFSLVAFPHGSVNVDERVYVQQGRALMEGHLVLPATFDPDHRPFFTAPNPSGELSFKYTPVWPAVLGASHVLFGSERPASGLAAGAAAVAVAALAFGVTGSARVARCATGIWAVTPLAVLLGGSRLSYSLALSLGGGAAGLLLIGEQHIAGHHRFRLLLFAGGVLAGMAFFARPYDALSIVVPAAFLAVLRCWKREINGDVATPMRSLITIPMLGAAGPLAGLLWTNRVITGNAFTLGYSLVGPNDRLGFGPRVDTPAGSPFDYGAAQAAAALWRELQLLVTWMPGGVIGVLGGALALRFATKPIRRYLIVATLIAVVAYVPVWGSWNGYVRLRAGDSLGPFYHLPVFALWAIALAIGCESLVERIPPARGAATATALLVAAVVASSVALIAPGQHLLQQRSGLAQRAALIDSLSDPPNSLVLPSGRELGYDFETFNSVDLDTATVYAIDLPLRRVTLIDRFPGRRVVRLAERYVFDDRPGISDHIDALGFARQWVREEIGVIDASDLRLQLAIAAKDPPPNGADPDRRVFVSFTDGEETDSVAGDIGGATSLEVRVAGDAVTITDLTNASASFTRSLPTGVRGGELCVGVAQLQPNGPGARRTPTGPTDEVCFGVERIGTPNGRIAVGGRGRTALPSDDGPVMVETDVSDVLTVTASP